MGPESSVNNLNGIPNFGHGFPEEHEQGESGGGDEGVQAGKSKVRVKKGAKSEVPETSPGDSAEGGGDEQVEQVETLSANE